MITLSQNQRLQNRIIPLNEEGDAVRLMGDDIVVDNVTVIDQINSNEAHRDAFQLIPLIHSLPNRQYAAATMKNPRITRSAVYSSGSLQGIFCSDGLLENVRITDNVISTCSAHSLTLCGVLSGEITRNYNGSGDVLPAVLNNLRIGGGVANIWVKSFKDHEYQVIKGSHIIDNRGTEHRKNSTYIEEFDLVRFRSRVNKIKYINTRDFCLALGDLAMKCSR